jgi:tRNA modification GTPase
LEGEINMKNETIAAIATPVNNAGIGIIRISGNEAINIVDKIFKSIKGKKLVNQKSHTIHYGHIVEGVNKIDEVLVSLMKAPNTFTREDVVEINCHGGAIVMKKVLEVVLKNGASLAEPGEFTKRAFLNGRIDLSQAEAVIEIINAKTELSLKSHLHQLDGAVSKKIHKLRENIIEIIAHIDAKIDYPEYDIDELEDNNIINTINAIKNETNILLKTADNGRIISEGIKTVIIGKPNVGKSSLLNAILREQRAIVTEIPGTTRDTLEEFVNINGIPLNIIDTAGIRETQDVVEKIGVEKSKNNIEKADLIMLVLDAAQMIEKEDLDIINIIKDKRVIVILNKIDLEVKTSYEDVNKLIDTEIIEVSAKQNIGIDNLELKLIDMFFNGVINYNDEVYITNVRHKDALERTVKSLELVLNSINMGMPEDCYSIDLKNSFEYLGEILGESVGEGIIDQIFSRFCLGK